MQKSQSQILVPGAGIEPACLSARHFKCRVYTISPPRHMRILSKDMRERNVSIIKKSALADGIEDLV